MPRWWNNSRLRGKQGDIVTSSKSGKTILCPQCGDAPVVYNGNYFCDDWRDGCDWALAHPAETEQDKRICDLIGIDYDM